MTLEFLKKMVEESEVHLNRILILSRFAPITYLIFNPIWLIFYRTTEKSEESKINISQG